jgi:hypothetical protein
MRNLNVIGTAALALAVAACSGGADGSAAQDLENVPDTTGLTLEVQGGAEEGLALAGLEAAAAAPAEVPDTGDDLEVAREKIAAVNETIRTFVGQIEAVAATNGVPAPGSATVYGPVDRCVVATPCDASGTASLKLTIARSYGSTWAFALEAAPVGTQDFKSVAAGWMRRAPVVRRGAGQIAFNLENLKTAAPAYPGQGYLLGGFATGPMVKRLAYVLTGPVDEMGSPVGFTPDPDKYAAVNAAMRGFKTAAGTSRVRVAGLKDLYSDADSDSGDELGFGHVVYNPSLGGRAYGVVTNYRIGSTGAFHGDVPTAGTTDHYFLGRACYAAGQGTPAYKEWFYCARGVGPAACVTAAGGAGTPDPGTAGTSWEESCPALSSAEFALPGSAPATSPDDTSPEQGEEDAGETPQDPPADPAAATPP